MVKRIKRAAARQPQKTNGKGNGTRHAKWTRADWALDITASWQKAVASIIETGEKLIAAKEGPHRLPHGEFGEMIDRDLPFGWSTADKLMKVARHPILANSEFARNLPASWDCLHEMTLLPEKALEELIASRRIDCETCKKDVAALNKEIRGEGLYDAEKFVRNLHYLCQVARRGRDPEALVDEAYPMMSRGIHTQVTLPDIDRLINWLGTFKSEIRRELARLDEMDKVWPRKRRGRKKRFRGVTFKKPPRRASGKTPPPTG